MANFVWNVASGSAAIDQASSYIDEATGNTPAGAPGDGDTIKFRGDNQGNATAGAATTNLGAGTVEVAEGYQGQIGDNGTPVDIDCASINYAGRGAIYHAGTVTGKIAHKHNKGWSYWGGTYSDVLYATRGNVVVQSNVTSSFSKILCGNEGNANNDVNLIVEADSIAIPEIVVQSGSADIRRAVTNLFTNGNTQLSGDDFNTTLILLMAGTLMRKAKGTDTLIHALSGLLDYSGDARPKTATTLYQYPGCIVNARNGAGSVTITNWISIGQTQAILDGASGGSTPSQA